MAQPPNYTPAADFSADELSNVGGRSTVSTAALDAELAAIETTLDAVLANISLNQRDDGEIRDARVKLHTLAADVKALLTAGNVEATNLRGDWATATAYVLLDVVSQGTGTYICSTAHTSGTFATDLAADKWLLIASSAAAASGISFTPSATIAATTVQAAVEEADTENRALSLAVRTDLASNASASVGAGMSGFDPALNYVAETLGAALTDGEIHMMWFITDATERAAIKAGTSTTDHKATIQAVMNLFPGRRLNFGAKGWRWSLSGTLNGLSGSTYCGKAAFRAINSAAFSIMLLCDGDTRVTVEDLEFDGNKANNGADYGVKFINGSKNLGLNLYVHDTAQCGGYIDGESDSFFRGGWFIDCGQNLSVSGGVATDNHGIMIIAAGLRTMSACGVQGVRVAGAYRKGVTAYVEIGATVEHIVIDGAVVSGCGLGGIYIAKQPGGTDMGTATLTGCHAWDNYVNFEIANVTNVAGAGNVSGASTAQGVVVTGVNDGAMPGFDISDSGAHGLSLVDTNNTAFGVINIRRANRGNTANQAGLAVHDSSYNVFSGGLIYDETPYQRYAILEDGTSDYNDFDGLSCVGAVTSLYSASGANSRWRTRSGANTALGAIVPRNTLDIDGGITTNEQALALGTTAGANNDVALAAKSSIVVVNNLTGAASITGIAGGHAGRRLTLVNYNGFTLTLKHADAGSTAANRFLLKSSADLVIAAQGSVELLYSSTIGGRWTVVG